MLLWRQQAKNSVATLKCLIEHRTPLILKCIENRGDGGYFVVFPSAPPPSINQIQKGGLFICSLATLLGESTEKSVNIHFEILKYFRWSGDGKYLASAGDDKLGIYSF